MRLYLSGPITGIEDYGPRFAAAADQLEAVGYTVVNPATIGDRPGWLWADYMRAALQLMCNCQGVALLPGWQESKGARLEREVADRLSMPTTTVDGWLSDTLLAARPLLGEGARR